MLAVLLTNWSRDYIQDKENDRKRSCNDNGQDETIDLVSSGSDSEESNMGVLSKRPAKKVAIKCHEISQFFVGSAQTANLSPKCSVVTKNSHNNKKSPLLLKTADLRPIA